MTPKRGSVDLHVTPINESEAGRPDEAGEVALGQQEHVVDDVLGRSDISVAVVPCNLEYLEEVECDIDNGLGEVLGNSWLPFDPTLISTDSHPLTLPRMTDSGDHVSRNRERTGWGASLRAARWRMACDDLRLCSRV